MPGTFIWDDDPLILQNQKIRTVQNPLFFFAPAYWMKYHPGTKGQYRPLRTVSFALTYKLWGFNPLPYRLTNVLIHFFIVFLIYLLVKKIFSNKILAFLTAVFFAVHPVHIETVTWIKNRSELFATFFYFSSWLAFIKSIERKKLSKTFYIISIIFFFFSLLSKETAVTLPIVLFLYIYCFLPKDDFKKQRIKILPYFFLVSLHLVFLLAILEKGGEQPFEFYRAITKKPDLYRHVLIIFLTIGTYLKVLLFPLNLMADYPFQMPESILDPIILPFTVVVLFYLLLVFIAFKNNRVWFFILAMIFITMIPVSNLKFFIGRPIAEHRLYLPSFGFCLFLGMLFLILNDKEEKRIWKKMVAILSGLLMVLYTNITIQRNIIWSDNLVFWLDAVKKNPYSPRTHYNLGNAYNDLGEYDKAIEQFMTTVKIYPVFYEAFNNLGVVYYKKGDYQNSIYYFNKGLEINPNFPKAHNNIANIYSINGEFNKAIIEYKEAISLDPYFAEAHYNLGNVYIELKRYKEAISELKTAINLEPGFPASYYNLANVYKVTDEKDLAIANYKEAVSLNPYFIEAYFNMGVIYKGEKNYDLAAYNFKKCLEIKPGFVDAHFNLGNIYIEQKKYDTAILELDKAITEKKDYAEIHNNLGEIFKEKGDLKRAVSECKKAIALHPNYALAHYNLGYLYIILEKEAEAVNEFKTVIAIDPKLAEAYYNLGLIFQKKNMGDKAQTYYRNAIKQKPLYFEAYLNLSSLYYNGKEYDKAISSLEKALEINPHHAKAHFLIGSIYLYQKDNIIKAKHHFQKTLSLDPDQKYAEKVKMALSFLEE
ncbi:MAG: tetratricopeptide repeat protein [Thermodesulfobacteriota bacterium]|nr:tetratricopeptide repeat protein [Thermodesulfobacteriota bacterium]